MSWHEAATFINQSDVSAGSERMASAMACGSSVKSSDFGLSSIINFLANEGKNQKELHEYGDVPPSYCQVKFWSKQFKWDREESIEDDSRSDRSVEAS